jgi:hypothetical protein
MGCSPARDEHDSPGSDSGKQRELVRPPPALARAEAPTARLRAELSEDRCDRLRVAVREQLDHDRCVPRFPLGVDRGHRPVRIAAMLVLSTP